MHEPDTVLSYSDNCNEESGNYSWDGKYIGAGKMTHVKLVRPNKIRQSIEFSRPFKSVKGNYEFLELAWYSAYAHLQTMKIKVDKTRPSLEIYENDPESCTSSNDWLTGIYIPVK